MINPIDRDALRRHVRSAEPFPHCVIDKFLNPDFAQQVHDAFPAYSNALRVGHVFSSVNEKNKVQITATDRFAPALLELHRMLASPAWLKTLSDMFDIRDLLADEQLIGGGIHETGPRGRLDVHIDFNYIADRQLHRRLNLLVFFNQDWKQEWGGNLELWNKEVTVCRHSFSPEFNRCVIFETSDISYHGVTAVRCPEGHVRKSFAVYYYTKEAPAHWCGIERPTLFRSRPEEVIKGRVLMPAEEAVRRMRQTWWDMRRATKKLLQGGARKR